MNDTQTLILVTVGMLWFVISSCIFAYAIIQSWLDAWAEENRLKLISFKLRIFDRGPFWQSIIPLPFIGTGIVYQVTVKPPDDQTVEGWVWLGRIFGKDQFQAQGS